MSIMEWPDLDIHLKILVCKKRTEEHAGRDAASLLFVGITYGTY